MVSRRPVSPGGLGLTGRALPLRSYPRRPRVPPGGGFQQSHSHTAPCTGGSLCCRETWMLVTRWVPRGGPRPDLELGRSPKHPSSPHSPARGAPAGACGRSSIPRAGSAAPDSDLGPMKDPSRTKVSPTPLPRPSSDRVSSLPSPGLQASWPSWCEPGLVPIPNGPGRRCLDAGNTWVP